jgi:type II secretory ATPase GspE/PulE/Tfp pilus assembly ATPase PilB-like protein
MTDELQSIEDLLKASSGNKPPKDDGSTHFKLYAKQNEIKIKEMERNTEKAAIQSGRSYINLFGFPISPEALVMIDEAKANKMQTVCFHYDGEKINLATFDPEQPGLAELAEELNATYYSRVEIFQVSSHSIQYALGLYKTLPKVRQFIRGVELSEDDLKKFSDKFSSFKDLQNEIDRSKISDIVTMIMSAAIKIGASDIHVEAEEKSIKIRFRIDGVLHDAATIDKELWKKIISRMKVLARVKINITDKPQDGRLSIITKNDRIDIRASFLPTNFGESVVMRLLKASSVGLAFEDLGIRGGAYEQLKIEIERPNGMIITTGPTGSGKTTTLYAILKKLNSQETKIITIEDPIEYQLSGVNQSQISEKYGFSQGLRSIVRQDPDVIMVGEIRDLETAETAIQAALTGHLVLSTIHTNDASGTVPRFLSMGAKPFLLAPALNAAIGQRLVRLLCTHCKTEAKISEEQDKKVREILNKLPSSEKEKIDLENIKYFSAVGCEHCQGIGYKGRIGIYEIMVIDGELEKVILNGKTSEYEMQQLATKKGMITMIQDGLLKVISGLTSVDEIFRVAEDKK